MYLIVVLDYDVCILFVVGKLQMVVVKRDIVSERAVNDRVLIGFHDGPVLYEMGFRVVGNAVRTHSDCSHSFLDFEHDCWVVRGMLVDPIGMGIAGAIMKLLFRTSSWSWHV